MGCYVSNDRCVGLRTWRPAICIALLLLATFAAPDVARADRRVFAYSYPYMTLPKGGFEIEQYLDFSLSALDDPSTNTLERLFEPGWRHQLEVEYALTDRWDIGVYQVFEQKAFQAFEYRGLKLRTRYRFADRGVLPVDTALYGEVAYYGDEVKFEERLILSKTVGQLETVLNLKVEQELKPRKDVFEFVFNPSLGVAYHISEQLAVGAEYVGKLGIENGERGEMVHFAGPAISVSSRRFWWTLTVQPRVAGGSGELAMQARSIFALIF